MDRIVKPAAILTAILVFLCMFAPSLTAAAALRSPESVLHSMSTSEKLCQMLFVSFGSYTDSEGRQTLSPGARDCISRHGFGGVIIFAQNAVSSADTVRLIDDMQLSSSRGGAKAQLLIACDQEGGTITRLGQGTCTPGNMALGAANDPSLAERTGRLIGGELSSLGINVDFAPSVDINNEPANPVIGVRSFSDSASICASLGVGMMRGLRSAGTTAVLKHFPGHGDTSTDSHTGLPSVDKTYEQIRQNELVPFQACINAGAEMIMTAHIRYPRIETEVYTSPVTGRSLTLPATLSERIITGILRGDMGFSGVVITDGMLMSAIAENFGAVEASCLAIEAGADLLLEPVSAVGSSGIQALENFIEALTEKADNGSISMAKIDAAVLRILRLKQSKGLLGAYDGSGLEARISYAEANVGSAAHHAEEWEITKRTVTLVKNNGALPFPASTGRIAVLIPQSGMDLSARYAIERLRREGLLSSGCVLEVINYDGADYQTVKNLIGNADAVIAVSVVKNASGLRSSNAALIERLIEYVHGYGGRFAVLSAHLPYDAARFPDADAVMLCYSSKGMTESPFGQNGPMNEYGPNIPCAIYMMFAGSPTAALPVNIPRLNEEHRFTNEMLYPRGFGLTYPDAPQPTSAPTAAPASESPTAEPTGALTDAPTEGVTEEAATDAAETPQATAGGTAELPDTAVPKLTPEAGTATPFFTPEPTAEPGDRTGKLLIAAAAVLLPLAVITALIVFRKKK